MAQYIGVDFGTSMLKAAVADGVDAKPSLLMLEPPSPFLPACVDAAASGGPVVGVEAFARRRRSGGQIAYGFRDRVLAPGSSVLVGGRSVSGQQLQSQLLGGLSGRIQKAAGGQVSGLVMAVPDHWSAGKWSLPPAMLQAGLQPNCCVREWMAVLAMQDDLSSQEVLLLSLGGGAVRATVCARRDGVWRPLIQMSNEEICGENLRKRLLAELCEEVIRQTRIDPREDDLTDQAVHDALETALRTLMVQPEVPVVAQLGGREFSWSLSRDRLAALAKPFRVRLQELVGRLLGVGAVGLERCPILAWGELALLLPVDDWLDGFGSRRTPTALLPLDIVAAGASRLCAALSTSADDWPQDMFGSVRISDGSYADRVPDDPESTVVRVLEGLPDRLGGAVQSARPALVLLGQEGGPARCVLSGPRFELGREPSCDWVFDFAKFPTVSGNHAAILRDGNDHVIKDLSSSNGTFLNGSEVRDQHVLKSGDVISLGQQGPQLRFEYQR